MVGAEHVIQLSPLSCVPSGQTQALDELFHSLPPVHGSIQIVPFQILPSVQGFSHFEPFHLVPTGHVIHSLPVSCVPAGQIQELESASQSYPVLQHLQIPSPLSHAGRH